MAGESFAGQYLPYYGDLFSSLVCHISSDEVYITTANAVLDSNLNIPLRGVAIGNGWMDARTQYPSFLDYALKHGITEPNSKVYRILPSERHPLNVQYFRITSVERMPLTNA